MKAKKIFKGMTAAAIAAVLAASMVPMTAFAAVTDNGGTLTVSNATGVDAGDTIKYYKVASLNDNGQYTWAWNESVFTGNAVPSAVSAYNLNNGLTRTNDNMKNLAALLARSVDTSKGTVMTLGTASNITEDGYYLVVVESGTKSGTIYQPMLAEVKDGNPVLIDEVKVETISMDKTITSVTPTGNNYQGTISGNKIAQVNVGDTIAYQLKTTIPSYDPSITPDSDFVDFTITDTPTNMTIDTSSIVVTLSEDADLSTTGDNVTLTNTGTDKGYEVNSSGKVVDIVLDRNNVILLNVDSDNTKTDYAGYTVFVTLNATLDEGATPEGDGNNNNGKVTYGNDYSTAHNAKIVTDDTQVFTTQLEIKKTDSADASKNLVATFDLYKENQTTKVKEDIITTGGTATINGLAAGTYYLKETVAPNGYVKSDAFYKIVIKASASDGKYTYTIPTTVEDQDNKATRLDANNGFTTTITNTAGQTLPGTGGVGTTIFTIAGVGVVLVAGAMLVVYMRKRRTEDEE